MEPLYLFSPPPGWWAELARLEAALGRSDADDASSCYASLFHALAWAGHADLFAAAADELLYRSTPFSRAAMIGTPQDGLQRAFESDLATLLSAVRRDWAGEVGAATQRPPGLIQRVTLMATPAELLLLDEPTEGLAPQIVQYVIRTIKRISEQTIPILLVEQNLNTVLEVADRVYILEQGRNVYEGTVDELRDDEQTQQKYLGVGTEVKDKILD
jgi:ABC-type branched-subunit amino acid transport system ATPase component